jgi:hypothetical protein
LGNVIVISNSFSLGIADIGGAVEKNGSLSTEPSGGIRAIDSFSVQTKLAFEPKVPNAAASTKVRNIYKRAFK